MSENIGQLKMPSSDGKMRKTDVATAKQYSVSYNQYLHQMQNRLNSGKVNIPYLHAISS